MNGQNNNKKENNPDKCDKTDGNRLESNLSKKTGKDNGQQENPNTSGENEDGSDKCESHKFTINGGEKTVSENTITVEKIRKLGGWVTNINSIVGIKSDGTETIFDLNQDSGEELETKDWDTFESDCSGWGGTRTTFSVFLYYLHYSGNRKMTKHLLGKIVKKISFAFGNVEFVGSPDNSKNGEIGTNKILIGFNTCKEETDIEVAICEVLELTKGSAALQTTDVKVRKIQI